MSVDVATLSIAVKSDQVKDATSAMDRMSSVGSNLEGVVKKIAAAWASWKVIEYAKQAATLAARYETLGAVMGVVGNNAGYTIAQMATFEKGLTQTGISMIGARDALTMMAGAQMDLTKSSQMARIAQDAAVIGNINSSEAFQRMVQGIRSGETEILRTIGISVNFEQAYAKVSRQLGKTAKDLTDTEKLMARQNVVMEYGSKIAGAYEASMGTAGKQLLSMQRYAEDLQVVFGAIFSDAFGIVVQSLNQALSDTKNWLDKNAEAAETMRFSLGSAAKNFVGLVKDVIGIASDMSKFNDELSLGEILTGGLALAMAVVRDAVMAIVGLVQTIYGAFATIISGLIYGVTKLIGMIGGFKPPAWMNTFYESSKGIFKDGGKNLQGGAISEFYNGAPRDLFAEVDADNAKQSALEAEARRIQEGNQARLNSDLITRNAKAAEEAAKAYAAAIQHKIEVMKWEAEAYNKSAEAASKHADAGIKDNLALQDFVNSLQPAVVEAEKMAQVQYDLGWALADGIINQEKYNELLGTAKAKFTAAGQAAEEYKRSLQQDASRLNNPTGEAEQRLNDMFRGGLIGAEVYEREMQKVRLEQLRLKAEAGSTWAIIGDVVSINAGHATDAMVDWMNNTDGLGRSWKSLGDTVRNVIADMLVQMQRAIVQQQLMQPLMQLAGLAIGSLAPSGATNSLGSQGLPSTFLGTGTGGGYSFANSMPSGSFAVPQSTGKAQSVININIASDGTSTTKNNGTAMAREMQRSVEPMVLQVIDKHMLPGGRLNPTRGGGIRG